MEKVNERTKRINNFTLFPGSNESLKMLNKIKELENEEK